MNEGVDEHVVTEPSAQDFRHARTLPVEDGWYKRAIFYEVLVRAFADSNRDGFGDLPGLTDRLDYLAWLGVDCLWLPPFYDSPLRDGLTLVTWCVEPEVSSSERGKERRSKIK